MDDWSSNTGEEDRPHLAVAMARAALILLGAAVVGACYCIITSYGLKHAPGAGREAASAGREQGEPSRVVPQWGTATPVPSTAELPEKQEAENGHQGRRGRTTANAPPETGQMAPAAGSREAPQVSAQERQPARRESQATREARERDLRMMAWRVRNALKARDRARAEGLVDEYARRYPLDRKGKAELRALLPPPG